MVSISKNHRVSRGFLKKVYYKKNINIDVSCALCREQPRGEENIFAQNWQTGQKGRLQELPLWGNDTHCT